MVERKHRFDTAHMVAVPHPRGRMSQPDSAAATTEPAPAENAEALADSGLQSHPGSNASIRQDDVDNVRPNVDPAHELELLVQRTLDSQPAVSFSSLEIRRIEGGICLEGILETNDQPPDIEHLVRSVADVDRILNRLVVRQLHELGD